MYYEELLKLAMTMTDNDDWENFKMWLEESPWITQFEYEELWEIGCDTHRRFIA